MNAPNSPQPPASPHPPASELERWRYDRLVDNRLHHDQLVWQVPAVSLTAQAFLFTISLASDSSRLARIVASLLSAVMALISVQLMARHRLFELEMARRVAAFEQAHDLPQANFASERQLDRGPRFARPLASLRSFDVWIWGWPRSASRPAWSSSSPWSRRTPFTDWPSWCFRR
jgi:hypothetical protein